MATVRIADFKARLSEHLRRVKQGRSITVLDHESPVVQIVPVDRGALEVRAASRRPRDLPAPPRRVAATDSAAVLLADRGRR